jgi:hypothetical protein
MAEDWAAKGRSNEAFRWQIDVIYAIGWSICGCILGSVLAVLGWRYWAGGKLGRVEAFTRERVGAVTAGSNCWAGCGGLYKLGCYGSLALVNKGEASKASADRACAGGAYADRACAGRAYIGRTCRDGACVDEACTDRA